MRRILTLGFLLGVALIGGGYAQSPQGRDVFRPMTSPPIPVGPSTDWVRTPIDRFILARLTEKGLTPNPEADRRTLIRRLSFDLTGLPPTPEAIAKFLADSRPDAYEQLVERLLSSPHYGERWARHWLDVAHYADSHGHDQDRFRPNAWPYRDYLISAFNRDIPYRQFVHEQIAGDVIAPHDSDAIAATGFLAAGPFDESSLVSIREDSIDRLIAQYLDRDDILTSVMSSFAGLTVGCARCHDHKFDPITQADYYSLQAVFAGVDKADRAYDADPTIARRRVELQQQIASLSRPDIGDLAPWLTPERQATVAAFEQSRTRWALLEPTRVLADQGTILKALLDRSILAVGPKPERDTYRLTYTSPLTKVSAVRLELLTDETLPLQGPGRQDNGNLHLSEIRVSTYPLREPEKKTAVKIQRAVADFDQAGWGVTRAIDGDAATAWGIHPAVGVPHEAVFEFAQQLNTDEPIGIIVELDQLHGTSHTIGRCRLSVTDATIPLTATAQPASSPYSTWLAIPPTERTPTQRAELARWLTRQQLEQSLEQLPPMQKVYCASNRFTAEGSFRPVAAPRVVHLLKRGEASRPQEVMAPAGIEAIAQVPAAFKLPNANDEGQRRLALAQWLTHPEHPTVWRTIVNRVWHYHFGRGIIDTPNDLGLMGGKASHPELLDYLATEFRDSGGSLKQLHRLIVTSAVYRQSSQHRDNAAGIDGDNRLLWRMVRTRLDAESVRDAILVASGRLDTTMGGPPVMHFTTQAGKHVTPDAEYEKFDVDSPASRRRGIYRFLFRTRPDPWLQTLDCPDSSLSAPVRGTSVSPLQALGLWNNPFPLRYAEHLATLAAEHSSVPAEQLAIVFQRVIGRPPTPEEAERWQKYVAAHGLANAARVLFNSSEFLFVD